MRAGNIFLGKKSVAAARSGAVHIAAVYVATVYIAAVCIVCCVETTTGFAKSPTEIICTSAVEYLSRNQIIPKDGSVLVAVGNYQNDSWKVSPSDAKLSVGSTVRQVYLAYLINRQYAPSAGAVSVKISQKEIEGSGNRINYVDLHRSEIYRGTNLCEPRGRREVNRQVRLNTYIDFHNGDGISSELEGFHFRYPKEDGSCERTDKVASRRDFQFDDVKPTKGDTLIARYFSFVGTAYAVEHDFSVLRSELHYQSKPSAGACVGISVPIGRSSLTKAVVTEQGFGGYLSGISLTIGREP